MWDGIAMNKTLSVFIDASYGKGIIGSKSASISRKYVCYNENLSLFPP